MFSDRDEGLHGKMLMCLFVCLGSQVGSCGRAFGEYTCAGGTWLRL